MFWVSLLREWRVCFTVDTILYVLFVVSCIRYWRIRREHLPLHHVFWVIHGTKWDRSWISTTLHRVCYDCNDAGSHPGDSFPDFNSGFDLILCKSTRWLGIINDFHIQFTSLCFRNTRLTLSITKKGPHMFPEILDMLKPPGGRVLYPYAGLIST